MSRTTRAWKRLALAAAAVIAAPVALVIAGPATEAEANYIIPCTSRTTAMPFQRWGDTRNYYLLQGGSFEGGTNGWSLYGNASVQWGTNSPFGVWGGGNAALKAAPGATVVAPSFCAADDEPYVRFFYKAPADSGAALKVTITMWRGSNTTSIQYWAWGGSNSWQVSPLVDLPDIAGTGSRTVSIKFEPVNSRSAEWLIDDLSVDPWKSLR